MTPEARVERLRVERLRVECVGKQVARVPLPVASAELATRSDDSKVSANSPERPITTLRHKKYPRISAQNHGAPARPLAPRRAQVSPSQDEAGCFCVEDDRARAAMVREGPQEVDLR